MVDEYELVSRKELEDLRGRAQAVPSEISPPKVDDTDEVKGGTAKIIVLNNNVEKLNFALKRLILLFDQAQKEMISKKPESDGVEKMLKQNEKLSNGIMSMANMIRDQQIQLNQLNLLYRRQQELLEEIRLQRRAVPAAFKIPPQTSLELPVHRKEDVLLRPAKHQESVIEIQTPPKIGQQILEEETEKYPAFSQQQGQEAPFKTDNSIQEEKAYSANEEQIDIDNLPPPPTNQRKTFLSRIVRK